VKKRAVELVSLMILTSCKTGAGTGRFIDEVSGMDGNARRGQHGWDNWHHRQGVRKIGCREPKKKRHGHSMSI
jgi:hypothetical protein